MSTPSQPVRTQRDLTRDLTIGLRNSVPTVWTKAASIDENHMQSLLTDVSSHRSDSVIIEADSMVHQAAVQTASSHGLVRGDLGTSLSRLAAPVCQSPDPLHLGMFSQSVLYVLARTRFRRRFFTWAVSLSFNSSILSALLFPSSTISRIPHFIRPSAS